MNGRRPLASLAVVAVVAVVAGATVLTARGAVAADGSTDDGGVVAARERLVAGLEADVAANPSVPGEAIAVRAPGLDVVAAAGLADVGAGTPLRPDTPFRVASVTKTFVAVAILRLVERGRIGLDDPISEHISRRSAAVLRADGYRPKKITVRQLLRHTAGIYDYAASDAYDAVNVGDPGHRWTRLEQLRFATAHGDPVGEPGEVFNYSDTGYVLLGEIIERATSESLATAVRRLVRFRRLRLDQTYWESFEDPPPGQAPRAHQYFGTPFDNTGFDNSVLDASADLYGGGGLVSTVSDLTRFYRALFHGKILRDPKTLRTMTRVVGAGRSQGAAMGIYRVDVDGETCFGHRGYWGTQTIHCPKLDLTFARTTNQADDDDFDSDPLERVVADLARTANTRS